MSDAARTPSPWRRRLRATVFSSTALALLALAAVLVMNELDRLIADVVSPSGRTHALSGVYGPGSALETEAWSDWGASAFPVGELVRASVVADAVLIACYGVLLFRLIRRVAPDDTRSRRWGLGFVVAFIVADALEDVMLVALSFAGAASGGWVWVQVAATYLKFMAGLAVLGYLFLSRAVGDEMRKAVGRGWRGLYAQRLVAIVVGAIAVVSLLTADGVIEQLPDVYRSWIGYGGLEAVPMLATLVAFAATGTGLLWLSRGRVRRYARSKDETREKSPLLPWYLTAAAVAIVGVAIGVGQNRGIADWVPLIVFVGVLLAIPLLSLMVRRIHASSGTTGPDAIRDPDTHRDAQWARIAGDVLLIVWVALAGLGP